MLTNIVVVQFSEMVQTARDKRYNLTCLYGGPGEAVVTSGYIGAGYYTHIILICRQPKTYFIKLIRLLDLAVRHQLNSFRHKTFSIRVFDWSSCIRDGRQRRSQSVIRSPSNWNLSRAIISYRTSLQPMWSLRILIPAKAYSWSTALGTHDYPI